MKKFLACFISLALVIAVVFSFSACGEIDRHHDLDGKTYELSGFVFAFKVDSSYIDEQTGEQVESYYYTEVSMEDMLLFAFRNENGIDESADLTSEQEIAFSEYKAETVKELIKNTEDDNKFSYELRFEDGKAVFSKKESNKYFGKQYSTETETQFDYELQEDDFSQITMTYTNIYNEGNKISLSGYVKLSDYNSSDKEYYQLIVNPDGTAHLGFKNDFSYAFSNIENLYENANAGYECIGHYEVYSLVK